MVAFSKLPVMLSDEDVVDKRYDNGKIYVIKCKYDDGLVYVGSTHMSLEKRFCNHKTDKKCSLYKYVNGDWDNWYIELYEEYPCKNKHILELKEGEVQRQIATINKRIAGRTDKQYYQENHEACLEKAKQQYKKNRDEILEKAKQYHQNNREVRLEKGKQYRQKNHEMIVEQRRQKITCDICGSIVCKGDILKHKKSQKCMNFKN